ncbi:MAG: NDP-sugar synthase [Prevotellaceae bacterium]|jgi:NDP-sugar pyrophosphorylase family protein|nr:NDP-sugar synthase [Prevotellaceae bacterium]
MNFAIIAAGEGSRLLAEGIELPKPLVPLNGVPMIARLIKIFVANNAEAISVIVNSQNIQTLAYLNELKTQPSIPLNIVVKSTLGSMHSLFELKPFLQNSDFCLTTVDTIFSEQEFSQYIQAFKNTPNIDGLFAVTDHIDDEKPLYIQLGEDNRILNFSDSKQTATKYISGGIYCLKPTAANVLEETIKSGMTRMRDFQRRLIAHGLQLKAFPFKKIIDVDHADDIKKAEQFLQNAV